MVRVSGGLWDGLGTMAFITAGLWLAVHSGLPVWAAWALALGAGLAFIGPKSGGHFNPAVTMGAVTGPNFPMPAAAWYIVMQLAGASAAMLLAVFIEARTFSPAGARSLLVIPAPGVGMYEAAGKEACGTFILVLTALAVGASGKPWAPWLIGGALGLAILLFGSETGGGFNPARSLAPYLVSREWDGLRYALIAHVGGPLVGGLAAGLFFRAIKGAPATV